MFSRLAQFCVLALSSVILAACGGAATNSATDPPPAADTAAPSVPAGLTAQRTNATTVSLAWSASTDTGGSGLAGYHVFKNGAQLTTVIVAVPSFTDPAATGASDSYAVRALDNAGNQSANSAPVVAPPPPDSIAPTIPGNLTGNVQGSTQIALAWNPSTDTGGSGLAGYVVVRNGTAINGNLIVANTYLDAGLQPNTSYTYVVRARDNAGNTSSDSNSITLRTPVGGTPPTAPSNLTAAPSGSTQISLSWSAAAATGGATLAGYHVFRNGTQVTATLVTGLSYSDTGLAPNTSYTYFVRAVDNQGSASANSNQVSAQTAADNQAPSAPTNLSAVVSGSSQINLTWTASVDTGGAGLAGYRVFRNGSQVASLSSAATSYPDSGLAPNTQYSYFVRAFDNAGNVSDNSNTVNAQTQAGSSPPTAPANLTATAVSSTQINLIWSASTDQSGTGLAGYRVFRDGVLITPNPIGATTFSDTGRAPNTTYSYFVRAADNNGNVSANSNTANATTPADTVAPIAPQGLSAVAATTSYQINLSWNASTDTGGSGVAGYRIIRNGTQINATLVTGTSYTDTGLVPSSPQSYVVRAVDGAGNVSGDSNIANATVRADTFAPTAPASLTATVVSSTRIDLSWSASTDDTGGAGLAGYRVFANGLLVATVPATSYSHTSLAANTSYTYVIRAIDLASPANVSGDSPSQTRTTLPDTTRPSAPTGLAGAPFSQTRIDLTWNAGTDTGGTGVAGYLVFRNGTQITPSAITSTSYSDTGLTLSTNYSYFVRTVDGASNQSPNSATVNVSTLGDTTAPSIPANLTASAVNGTEISLNWSASTDTGGSGLAGYRVFRNGVLITPTIVSVPPFLDTGLTANTNYSYTVRAVDGAGNESGNSDTATAITAADATPPSTPASLAANAVSASQINLAWTASTDSGGSGLAGYHVYRGGAQVTASPITTTSYSDSGLAPNTSYSYTVRAIDGAGNLSANSNTANAQTQPGNTPPTAPTGLSGSSPSQNTVDLSWGASTDNSGTGIAGYHVFRGGVQITGSPVAATSFSDAGLTPSTAYQYFVRGVDNNGGVSGNSNTVTVTTAADTTAPSIPSSVSATANSSTQITVTWSTSTDPGGTGVAGYRVFRGGALITPSLVIGTSFIDTALAANTAYSYTVRAVDNSNNVSADSSPPATATTLPDTTPPSSPAGLSATANSSTQITVTWSASTDTGGSGLAGYRVFRDSTLLTPSPIASTSFVDSGRSPNTTYSYVVQAIDGAGNLSTDAGPVQATTPADSTPPPAPTGLAANATGSTSINLSWNSVLDTGGSGLQGYLVFRGVTQLTPSAITALTYTDIDLTASTNYSYTVRAVDNAGNISAASASANATTLADTEAPTAPSNLTFSTSNTPSIQLSWSPSTDTGGSGLSVYVIYRNGAQLNTSASTNYTDSAIAWNTDYTYFVRARDGANNLSGDSNSVVASVDDAVAPNAPSGLTAAAAGASNINLSWTAGSDPGGSGVAGYRVYRGGTLVNPGALILGTTFNDGGLAANTNYSYVVLTVDLAGNESVDSNTASATTSGTTSGLDTRPSNTSCLAPNEPTASASFAPQRVYPNRSFAEPLAAMQAPNDSSLWFVMERLGTIRSFSASDTNGSSTSTFINITDRVYQTDGEMGLLGMAFHPNYASNGYVYLSYTAQPPNGASYTAQSRVSRFTRQANGTLDPASEVIVLRIPQPLFNHNGGNIAFGPDGFLYIGMGDGGGAGDPNGYSQNKNTLLGKMVRIDVDVGSPYSIPPGNLHAANPLCSNNSSPGGGGAACPEIYSIGFRNPWRWSFDKGSSTPKIWLGDVGQSDREEVDIVELGGNYGWNCREGNLSFTGCSPVAGDAGFINPIVDYGRSTGFSVIGGYVYRGTQLPSLVGRYLFGDFSGFNVFEAVANQDGTYTLATLINSSTDNLTSFAQDNAGELYMLGYNTGGIYKIVASSATQNDTVAVSLADTGCFVPGNLTQPTSGLIPYRPNAPFWSDNAVKERWLALPDSGRITVGGDGDWSFPNGTVLVKNFSLNSKVIETRLFMKHADTGNWRGYTYRWNSAQTAATRVDGGLTTLVEGQNWTYPSGTECLVCHTSAAGRSLGLETAQQNGTHFYPATGRTANQITTFNTIDLFTSDLPDPSGLPAYADPFGAASLANRARAYLHTNCAQCHRPGGPTGVSMDLRNDTAIASTNTCNVNPVRGDLGISGAKLIAPGQPSLSIVLQRMNRRGPNQMPPLGSHIVDSTGASLLSEWIAGMNGSCN